MRTGDITYEHTQRFFGLTLELLVQILIKVHGGVRWGYDDEQTMALTRRAGDFSKRCLDLADAASPKVKT